MFNIAVYGPGIMGREVIRSLRHLWKTEINIVAVYSDDHKGDWLSVDETEYQMYGFQNIDSIPYDFILVALKDTAEEIAEKLADAVQPEKIIVRPANESIADSIIGILYALADRSGLDRARIGEIYRNRLVIPYLVVCVGSACTLRCRDCSNFAPYAPPDTKRYDLSSIIGNIQKVLAVVDRVGEVQVQGGEPFLYTDLDQALAFLLKEEKVETISIATNGTLIPKAKLLPCLKNHRLSVRISDYGEVNTAAAERFASLLEREGIRYRYYQFASGKGVWFDSGPIDCPREDNNEVVSRRFCNCRFQKCYTLEDGIIGRCSRSTVAKKVQGFTEIDGDYVHVADENLAWKLRQYWLNPHFMEACRYCYGTEDDKEIIPAVQDMTVLRGGGYIV